MGYLSTQYSRQVRKIRRKLIIGMAHSGYKACVSSERLGKHRAEPEEGRYVRDGAVLTGTANIQQLRGERVRNRFAGHCLAADEMHPGSDRDAQTLHRARGRERSGDGWKQAERQFLGAVPGDLRERVAQRRIAKPLEHR